MSEATLTGQQGRIIKDLLSQLIQSNVEESNVVHIRKFSIFTELDSAKLSPWVVLSFLSVQRKVLTPIVLEVLGTLNYELMV